MIDALTTIRLALRDTWQDLFTTAVVNLLWLILNLLIVTGPPATLALFYVGNRIAHGEPTDVRDFFEGLRRYFGLGWRWGLLNAGVLSLLVGDVILTGRLGVSTAVQVAQGLYIAILAGWLLLQVYAVPFLFEQETPSLRLALRNGVMMMGKNLQFSAALAALLLAVLFLGTVLFLLSVAAGGVFLALAGSHAVQNRLAAFRAAAH